MAEDPPSNGSSRMRRLDRQRRPRRSTTVEVATDGSFLLADVPSPGFCELIIEKAGFAAEARSVSVRGGQAVEGIEIVLREGVGVVSGLVEGPAGALGNVTVEIPTDQPTDGPSPSQPKVTSELPFEIFQPRLRTPSRSRVPASRPALSIVLDDSRSEIDDSHTTVLGTRLDCRTGHVDRWQCCRSALITVTGADVQRTTRSMSATGAYLIADLPAIGLLRRHRRSTWLCLQTQAVELGATDTGNDLRGRHAALAADTGTVEGIVRDDDGNELGSVRIPGQWGRRVHGYSADATDQLGRFRIDRIRLAPTPQRSRAGSSTSALLVTIASGLVTEQDVVLAPKPVSTS